MDLKEHIKIKQYDSYQERLEKMKSGEFSKPISSEIEEKISNVLTNPESKETQSNFHEQEILNQWKEKFPEWYKENANKIVSHPDGIEFYIHRMRRSKIQRENLKPEPNGTTITKIPEEKLKELSPELQEKLKDEVLIDFDSAQEESAKIGMRPMTVDEWILLVEFMPGRDHYDKGPRLMELLDLPLAGCRDENGIFKYQGVSSEQWTSTYFDEKEGNVRIFTQKCGDWGIKERLFGFSVRCIFDY